MQNLPRLFIDAALEVGKEFPLTGDQLHYLQKVMRVQIANSKQQRANYQFLVFNNRQEFGAELKTDGNLLFAVCYLLTGKPDPSNKITFAFAPIKQSRMEEMLNAATQMGVAKLQPVITERTTEKFPKWDRIKKIIIEASEQSGRNSIPELLPPKKFSEFLKDEGRGMRDKVLVFADERFAHNTGVLNSPLAGESASASKAQREPVGGINKNMMIPPTDARNSASTPPQGGSWTPRILLIGPEGGFSPDEFAALDASGAIGISLGKTILRAETAAIAALAKLTTNN